ncbi:PAS domain-containing protein [Meridianimarinicoccus roseus]|jgi:hypothetical protein|uniref:PAS domain-containing protein n=1 Tax=Meridianimarinicoccus roseus TaxID=2072018 RepID=A0A2V2LHI9_9RHOB|nr:PAS domain-containing protein [Meridianimarinicoccus roseus]PWR02994.1 PAS domain-containing protein [Meridianimarinicoccus roseus]
MRAFEMKHPAVAQIEAYWEALRGDRNVPLRSEVDPRGIDQALENAFILERIAPRVARFRLAGMHLNDLMGMEVRGMPVTSLFTNEARSTLTDILEHVFEEPSKARLRLTGETGIGRGVVTGEMILLPLRSDLGDISRALGCLVTDGRISGRAPQRFTIAGKDMTPLTGLNRFSRPATSYAPPRPAATPNTLNEEAGAFDGGASIQGAPRRAPHLRLVHDIDRHKS